MALSAQTAWEVRTTGADTNGGGFVAGATGTDYSFQDSAQYTDTNLAVDATTNTKVTSATHNFVAADVGNIMQISAGAGFTTGFYQIVSVASNAATLDRSPAATSTTGGTYAVGGALATLSKLSSAMVGSNKAFIKASGGYTSTATLTFSQSVTPSVTAPHSRLIGYTTTRSDGGKATLTLSTNTGIIGISTTGAGWIVENISVNCSSLGTSTGISCNTTYNIVRNCLVSNFATNGIVIGTYGHIYRCEVTGGVTGATAGLNCSSSSHAYSNWSHNNACTGIVTNLACTAIGNLSTNNTGATSDGISISYGTAVINNTSYGNGRYGAYYGSTLVLTSIFLNNIFAGNVYGMVVASGSGTTASPGYDGNAYWNNSTGNRLNSDDTTVNKVNGVAAYTNTLDVILSADPFVDKANNDFRLNNTAGGGASCRGHGVPASWPGNSLTAGYIDFGATQHIDPPSTAANDVY